MLLITGRLGGTETWADDTVTVSGGAAGLCSRCNAMAFPHAPQKLFPGGISLPHLGQRTTAGVALAGTVVAALRAAPHLPQKFLPSVSSARQLGQIIVLPLWLPARSTRERETAVLTESDIDWIDR